MMKNRHTSYPPLKLLLLLGLCLLPMLAANAQSWKQKYTRERPLIIVGDWDKPPYEFLDRDGHPAGTNIETMALVFKDMGIPFKYVLKDWGIALKMFEMGQADVILANANRYRNSDYAISENIINYNRICVASLGDSARTISHDELLREGVVLKPSDYTRFFFNRLDSAFSSKVEFQSPKVALTGLTDGIYKYFVWGEEPLKWKIRELNLSGIVLNEVQIPVSDIYIIGRDHELIEDMDDHYSRLKQSGQVQAIIDRWLHPERIKEHASLQNIFLIIGILLLAAVFYFLSRLARKRVEAGSRSSSDLNNMMERALHMGNFDITQYDIKHDRMTNLYGHILPDKGVTLEEFIAHIHPSEQAEFRKKMERLLSGREKKFELNKRWKTFDDGHTWLYFQGHAILEVDSEGRPAYVINAVHDVTHDEKTEHTNREIASKYKQLSNLPFFALSFYDKDGWLLELNQNMERLCGMTESPETRRYWESICMFDIPLFRSAYPHKARYHIQACMHMEYPDIGINRYIDYEMRPLFNARGELANYFCSTIDITDRRQHYVEKKQLEHRKEELQQRINQQKAWLVYLLRNSDRLLMRHDAATQQITCYCTSEQPVHVFQLDDFCTNYITKADQQRFRNLLSAEDSQAVQTSTIHMEAGRADLPGTTFVMQFSPVVDAQGNIMGHKGISHNITTLDNARKRLADITASR